MADDANDLARHVEHRASGVARIDRSVRLEELSQWERLVHSVGRIPGADEPGAQGVAEPVRSSDHDHAIADRDLARARAE